MSWPLGTMQNIKWQSYDCHEYNADGSIKTPCTVTIQISYNNGDDWTTIVEGVATTDDGVEQSYSWLVEGEVSEACLVRVVSELDGSVLDQSDEVFEISEAILSVNSRITVGVGVWI